MKNRKLKWIALLAIGIVQTNVALAEGGKVGNGGDGILIKGVPYLLDLVEAGVHLRTLKARTSTCTFIKRIETQVDYSFADQAPELRTGIVSKIAELCEFSPLSASAFVRALSSLSFSWVPLDLIDIKDEETPLNYDPKVIVQLAARVGLRVMVDEKLWPKLTLANQVGLILHEVAYSMLNPENMEIQINGKIISYQIQRSPHAREMTGILFSSAQPALKQTQWLRVLPYLWDPASNSETKYDNNVIIFADGDELKLARLYMYHSLEGVTRSTHDKEVGIFGWTTLAGLVEKNICRYLINESDLMDPRTNVSLMIAPILVEQYVAKMSVLVNEVTGELRETQRLKNALDYYNNSRRFGMINLKQPQNLNLESCVQFWVSGITSKLSQLVRYE